MNRRQFISDGLAAAAGAGLAKAANASSRSAALSGAGSGVAVMAELLFAEAASDRAAGILGQLAEATRAEPGCRRYSVAQDLAEPGRFHLSELWEDLAALAAHFETPHMAEFSSSARSLGYSAPWMKLITVAGIEDLNPKALRASIRNPARFSGTGEHK